MGNRKRRDSHRDGHYRKTRLRNGLRVVTEKIPSVHSVSIGVWVDVGSRDERPDEQGLTHFVEHMVFKGTPQRNAFQIAAELESLGGSLNAFTSREQTCFTARILDEHLDKAIDVLADIVCNPTLTAHNLNREKLVIGEEIKEAFENPTDRIFDEFAQSFWGHHPLGQPILGTTDTVMKTARSKMLRFIKRQYRTGSIVVAATGAVSHRRLVNLVRQKFSFEEGLGPNGFPAERNGWKRLNVVPLDAAQTHLCVGFPGLSYDADDRMAALALHTYLGSGMSSALFQKVRERKGLAYSVFSFVDSFRDSGIFGCYAGTDSEQAANALEIILQELNRVKKRRLPTEKFDTIINQLKGQLLIASESTPNRMYRLAHQELMLGRYVSPEDVMALINALTPADLLRVANQLFDPDQMTVTALGSVDESAFKNVVG